MEKYITLIIITLFTNSNLFSQIYRLEYKFAENIPSLGYREYNTRLDYNLKTNESIYTVLLTKEDNESNIVDNGFVIKEKILDNTIIYNNFKDSITIIQEQIDIEMLLFKEKTPNIKWDLTNEIKFKNNLNLKHILEEEIMKFGIL